MAAPSAIAPVLDAALKHQKPSAVSGNVSHSNTNVSIPDQIRIVQPHEYKAAAATLAAAFATDHVVRYSIDTPDHAHLDEATRYAIHLASMEYVTYAHCLNGLVLTVGPNFSCVALWLPPGKNIDDWWTILRSGMWRMNWMLSAEGKERFFTEFLPLLANSKAEVLGPRDQQSWYLNYIGTKAEGRGKGYARMLVEYVTRMADDQGLPCYLESSHDINLKIYGKMGFELRKQIFLLRDEGKKHRMDVMVREPRSSKKG